MKTSQMRISKDYLFRGCFNKGVSYHYLYLQYLKQTEAGIWTTKEVVISMDTWRSRKKELIRYEVKTKSYISWIIYLDIYYSLIIENNIMAMKFSIT